MNYTSIEQSKKLMELGLDPKSADMSWEKLAKGLLEEFIWQEFLGPNPAIQMNTFSFRNGYVLPCWSTDALLNLMPPYLFEWDRGIDLIMYPNANLKKRGWHLAYMPNNINSMQKDKFRQISHGDTPIEAAYNMMVWLLQNDYIKTE